jgi:hypothetical protein
MLTSEKNQRNAATAAALIEAGIEIMRERIKRQNPSAPPETIDALLRDWRFRANDAIPGDTAGNVRIRRAFV